MAFGKALKGFASQVAQKMQDKPAQPAPAPAKGPMGRIAEKVGSAMSGNKPAPAPTKAAMQSIASRLKGMRFQEGGSTNPYQGDDVDPFSGARNKAGETDPAKQEPKADSKNQSFKSAFAAARKEGKKTFSWNGKKYTTELASSKPAAKSSASKGYMSKKADDDRAYRAPKMGEEGFMAKRMSPSEAANARTSADYKGKSARDMGMGSRMDPMQAATAGMDETEKVGTYKKGGKVKKMDEMKMMGRMGRGMAKADMQKKMQSGGIASSLKAHASAPASKAHGKKMMGGGMAKYAKGGMIDGCARKGKTKGRMV